VKEINQALIDDFLVLGDKIGSANFYWSFPSKAYVDALSTRESLQERIEQSKESIKKLRFSIEVAKENRKAPNRTQMLAELNKMKIKEKDLDEKLEKLKYNDPEEIKKIDDVTKSCIESVNRWTDNIWIIKSFLTKKKGMSGKEVK
jgi:hypothetical protein